MKTFFKFFGPLFLIFLLLGLWSGRRARLASIDPHFEIGRDIRIDLKQSPPLIEFVCGGRPVWQFDIDNKAARRIAPDFAPRLTALSLTERWEASYLFAIAAFGGIAEFGKMGPGLGTQREKVLGMLTGIVSGYSIGFGLAYYSRLDCASPEVYTILTSKTAGIECQPDIWRAVAAPKIFAYSGLKNKEIEFPASYTLWSPELLKRVTNGDNALSLRLSKAVESYTQGGFHAQSGLLTSQDLASTGEAVELVVALYRKNPDRFKIEKDGKTYELTLVDAPKY
jgi:hypothetical protein